MRTFLLASTASLILGLLPRAGLTVPITFDELVTPFSGAGKTFFTQGFQFVMGADNTAEITAGGTACGPECSQNGTEYLLNLDSGRFAAVTMSLVTGGAFSLLSFDAAEAFEAPADYLSATTISVLGTRSDGTTLTSAYSLDGVNDGSGNGHDFERFFAVFLNVTSVTFNGSGGPFSGQDGNFYQFFALDNINVIPRQVPEPFTTLLLLTGLGALSLRRRAPRFCSSKKSVPTPRKPPD